MLMPSEGLVWCGVIEMMAGSSQPISAPQRAIYSLSPPLKYLGFLVSIWPKLWKFKCAD